MPRVRSVEFQQFRVDDDDDDEFLRIEPHLVLSRFVIHLVDHLFWVTVLYNTDSNSNHYRNPNPHMAPDGR